jgi:SAM-dependent methyltransferase
MPMTGDQLKQEAAFADADYNIYANELALNRPFFQKYANPQHDWDWREFGAKLLRNIQGKQLLDYGCGQGEEALYFALMGAEVTAIDVSPVGVELTNRRAKHNQVEDRLHAFVMRCDPTPFPDESFDVVHGFGILHHVGLEIGLREVKRLLRKGGRAIFFEHMGNSEFIERVKNNSHYTENERPLKWKDVANWSSEFRRFSATPFHIFSRLRRRIRVFDQPLFRQLDYWILRCVPGCRYFASGIVIYLEK